MDFAEIAYEVVADQNKFVPFLIAASIVLGITVRSIASIFTAGAQERTRREIAAFIAEGSMTPEQGERLLTSGRRRGCG
jgi:hypothetical protein